MSEIEFIFRSRNTHQVLIALVVDTRILGCVADSLQERRFASISPTYYKDTKACIFCSEVIGVTVAHGRCGWVGKEGLRGKSNVKFKTRNTPKCVRYKFKLFIILHALQARFSLISVAESIKSGNCP